MDLDDADDRQLTTAARSTSVPTASSTSPSATTPVGAQRPVAVDAARQDAADQSPTARFRPTTRSPLIRAPVTQPGDLGARPAQPVHLRAQPRRPGRRRCSSTTSASSTWEEVNDGVAGANYGWPAIEGYGAPIPALHRARVTPTTTIADGGCAITGGAFYTPANVVFPGGVPQRLLLRRLLRRLDPAARSRDGNTVTGVRHRYRRARST